MKDNNSILERDVFSIEMNNGEKIVHIIMATTCDCDNSEFEVTEFTSACENLNEFIPNIQSAIKYSGVKGIIDYVLRIEENAGQYYVQFNKYGELVDYIRFNGELPTQLDYEEITENTPCGLYITKRAF